MAFPFLSWCFSLRFLLPSPPPSPPPPPSLNTYTQTNTWTQGERRVSGKKKKQQRIHIISFLKSNKYKGICPPDWEKQPFAYLHWFFFLHEYMLDYQIVSQSLTPLSMSPLLSSSIPMSPLPLPRFRPRPPLIIPRPPLPLPRPRPPLPPGAETENEDRVTLS